MCIFIVIILANCLDTYIFASKQINPICSDQVSRSDYAVSLWILYICVFVGSNCSHQEESNMSFYIPPNTTNFTIFVDKYAMMFSN